MSWYRLSEGQGQVKASPPGDTLIDDIQATQAAAARSHGLASARTLQRMQPVREAPLTRELVRSGKIKTATAARGEALKELGKDKKEPAISTGTGVHPISDGLVDHRFPTQYEW